MSLYNKIKLYPNYLVSYFQRNATPANVEKKPERAIPNNYNNIEPVPAVKNEKKFKAGVKIDNSTNGIVSKQAQRNIKKAVNWLVALSDVKKYKRYNNKKDCQFQINFITLTLPSEQIHSDNEIKKECLNNFLIEAKRKWNLSHYVWRAEIQQNGNIHFHVTCNKFIPHTELRDTWNRIINKLGYVDRYRLNMQEWHKEGFKPRMNLIKNWSIRQQKKAYEKGINDNWSNPNATDVHPVKSIKNIAGYLCKYFSKNVNLINDEFDTESIMQEIVFKEVQDKKSGCIKLMPVKRIIQGKLWGLSYSLSRIEAFTEDFDSFIEKSIDKIKTIFENCYYAGNFFEVIFLPAYTYLQYLPQGFEQLYKEHINYYKQL